MMLKNTISIILFFCLFHVKGQEEAINANWVKKDSVNYHTILNVLADSALVKNDSEFFKKIVPFHTLGAKDLEFGLKLIHGGQYGGYTTAWISALVYENEIIQFEISYDEDDSKIIDYLIQKDELLSEKIKSINRGGPDQFTYKNSLKLEKYKKEIAGILGAPKTINLTGNAAKHFDLLTNPLLNYDFGTWCYASGAEPIGRRAINYFIELKDTSTIREVIKGYNPEGRLYAVDALFKLSKNKVLVLSDDDKKLIKIILTSKTPIKSCQGCIVSHKVAADLIVANNDYSEEIEVIKKENKIRREQGQPKRKGY